MTTNRVGNPSLTVEVRLAAQHAAEQRAQEPPSPPTRQAGRPSWTERYAWTCFRFSPALATTAAFVTIALYLAEWPYDHNRGVQLAVGLGIGAVVWLLASGLATRDVTSVHGAGGADTYEELRGRVIAAQARLAALRAEGRPYSPFGQEGAAQAEWLLAELDDELAISDGAERAHGSPYRWPLGHGYVNSWRRLHEVEDLLVAIEPPEDVYAAALRSLDRALPEQPAKARTRTTGALEALVGTNGRDGSGSGTTAVAHATLHTPARPLRDGDLLRLGRDDARSVVRESFHGVHKAQNEAWDKIVNLRNALFTTFTLAVWLTYALLALAVLQPDRAKAKDQLTAAVAFFLVGAAVGVFSELWSRSKAEEGTVFDYGLGRVRLIATPVLSGLAALGGVLVTNLLGSYVVAEDRSAGLAGIFDLGKYPMGLIVAAIFGLTPGLLLERLNARKAEYDKQIELPAETGVEESSARPPAGQAVRG